MYHREFPPLLSERPVFPDIDEAIAYRDGLVAIGGDLSKKRILSAYQQGIFPWFSEHEPICWWVISPRMVLFPEQLHVGRSTKKAMRTQPYQITVDHAFQKVVGACARRKRPDQNSTWIVPMMQEAYCQLHKDGYAHSFEYWHNERLSGGLYGVLIGQVFYGESMFALSDNASKIAFVHTVHFLKELGVKIIDCQMYTDHLARFGATQIPFSQFQEHLDNYCQQAIKQPILPCLLSSN